MKSFITVVLVLFFLCGNNAALVSSCTQSQANELGCDVVLDAATFGGGHPDYFQIGEQTSITTSYAGQTLCVPAGSWSALALRYVEGTAAAPVKIINCGGQVSRKWNQLAW